MEKIEMARKGVLAPSSWRLLFLEVAVLVLLPNCASVVIVGETLSSGASLNANQSIISKNGSFALGFFSPNGSNNWYVGIWYAQIPDKTVVWVANRETPMKNTPGVLTLATDGHLKLFDSEGHRIWSTDNDAKASSALLEDNGNFVMLRGNNNPVTVWESFDYPGDTWLAGMKLWKWQKLNSWKSSIDPAPGRFSLGMDSLPGKTQFFLVYENNVRYWYSGEWTGDRFSNMPEMLRREWFNISFVKLSPSRMYFTYMPIPKIQKLMPRVVMDKSGEMRAYIVLANERWNFVWSEPLDQCGVYGRCGAFGACQANKTPFCSCLQGFTSADQSSWDSEDWWSSGCVRRSPLQCSPTNGTTDGFVEVSDKSLPDGHAVSYNQEQTLQGCRALCLKKCSCTAFAITTNSTSSCRLWFGDLLNVRDSPFGQSQSLYIRLAASELRHSSSTKSTVVSPLSIVLPIVAAFIAVLALLFALFIRRRRHRLLAKRKKDDLPTSLKIFTYKEMRIATRNFSQKLGSGAFGSVFKGTLPDNTLVAVKRIESSAGAEKQFRAEISTIGNIQHVNLVRLCGFCIDGCRRLLVYEYMPNGSLNTFLFTNPQRAEVVLDWNTRFKVIVGVARGLVYLHEECKDRIIHCDIKPENILVDEDFRPKLADFGMAKLVGRDFSRVLTTTRGTRGYLAPEWISGLPITSKADVYSFGMTVLEIISGRRNLDLTVEQSSRLYFPTWAASQFRKGDVTSIVDAKVTDNADLEEVRRAAAVGFLCIEEDENVRPNMSHVLQILEGRVEPYTPQHGRDAVEHHEDHGDGEDFGLIISTDESSC